MTTRQQISAVLALVSGLLGLELGVANLVVGAWVLATVWLASGSWFLFMAGYMTRRRAVP